MPLGKWARAACVLAGPLASGLVTCAELRSCRLVAAVSVGNILSVPRSPQRFAMRRGARASQWLVLVLGVCINVAFSAKAFPHALSWIRDVNVDN